MKKKERKALHRVLKVFLIFASAGVLAFAALVAFVCIKEGQVPRKAEELSDPYEAIIVLGAQVKPEGVPSIQLELRLECAYEVWLRNPVPVVVCGAQGTNEPDTEAAVMKRYLESKGIPGEMILEDPDSFNTQENLKNASGLLKAYPEKIRKVLIVSSDYHVPRAIEIARDLHLDAAGIGSPCRQEFWIKNHFREALAWCKYWLKKIF